MLTWLLLQSHYRLCIFQPFIRILPLVCSLSTKHNETNKVNSRIFGGILKRFGVSTSCVSYTATFSDLSSRNFLASFAPECAECCNCNADISASFLLIKYRHAITPSPVQTRIHLHPRRDILDYFRKKRRHPYSTFFSPDRNPGHAISRRKAVKGKERRDCVGGMHAELSRAVLEFLYRCLVSSPPRNFTLFAPSCAALAAISIQIPLDRNDLPLARRNERNRQPVTALDKRSESDPEALRIRVTVIESVFRFTSHELFGPRLFP